MTTEEPFESTAEPDATGPGRILAELPVAVWSADRRGVISFADGAALSAIGLAPGVVVGRSVHELYADRPDLLGLVRQALAGQPVTARLEFGGRLFEARVQPSRDGADEVVAVVALVLDVSARARDENELERRGRLLLALATIAQRDLL